MRLRPIAMVLLAGACGGSSTPVAAPAPVTSTCAGAAEHVIELLAAPLDPRPPDDKIAELVTVLRERCEQDGWSAEARQCLGAMQHKEDAARCSALLTEAQLQALAISDQRRQAGGAGSDAGSGSGSGSESESESGPR